MTSSTCLVPLDVDPLGSRPPGAFLDQLQRQFNLKKAKGSIVQRLFGMSYWFGMPQTLV
jgi:hypothetical protein